MWKATTEQLNKLKFYTPFINYHKYYWENFVYEFDIETNELINCENRTLISVIESFEHFKQVMKILLTEKLYISIWEDEIKELIKQIENL